MSEGEARGLRDLAEGERDVAGAWLDEGNLDAHWAHLREALRLELLSRHSAGTLTALVCATAVVMAESWDGDDVEELIAACRDELV